MVGSLFIRNSLQLFKSSFLKGKCGQTARSIGTDSGRQSEERRRHELEGFDDRATDRKDAHIIFRLCQSTLEHTTNGASDAPFIQKGRQQDRQIGPDMIRTAEHMPHVQRPVRYVIGASI